MRTPPTICTLAIGLLLSAEVKAEEKPSADTLRTAVRNLAAKRYNDRYRAARTLEAFGPSALKALQEASQSNDVEVRDRAAALARKIEMQVRNESLAQAPKLRLRFANVPLRTAVAEVAKKTGLPLVLDEKHVRNLGLPMTLDTGEVPFWQAIEQFMAAAGLTENPDPEPGKQPAPQVLNGDPFGGVQQLQLFPHTTSASPQDARIHLISGTAAAASADKIIRVKATAKEIGTHTRGSNEYQLILDVTPAPNVGWQGLTRLDVHHAVDDRDRVLKQVQTSESDGETSWGNWEDAVNFPNFQMINNLSFDSREGGRQNSFTNPYHYPIKLLARESRSKFLKELHGIVSARILTPVETLILVEDLYATKPENTFHIDGLNLRILEIKDGKSGFQTVRVRLDCPAATPQMLIQGRFRGRMQPFLAVQSPYQTMAGGPNKFELQDADGKPLSGVQQIVSQQEISGDGISTEFTLTVNAKSKADAPLRKLALKGRLTADVEIPFTLKNVPLP